jgi:uncharacterized protein (UPF0548 family)
VLGTGGKLFKRISQAVTRFEAVNNLSWAEICTLPIPRVGSPLASVVKAYGLLYTFNPCRLVDIKETVKSRQGTDNIVYSQVCFSTVGGHMIAGEERFRVIHNACTDEVEFSMFSFTKGSGLLGTLAMPFIRPLQKSFFKDIEKSMVAIAQTVN